VVEVNKIHLGDCYEVIKQIPDKSIDLIYTDIPYLFRNGGSSKESELGRQIAKVMTDLNGITDGIDYKILNDFVRVLKKINCFIWCSKEQIVFILNYFVKLNCHFEILAWVKSNPLPMTNNTFLPDIEYCLYFRESGIKLNPDYELKSKWYMSTTNQRDKNIFTHPTIKPLELVKRHIQHTTQENDVVLDCFIGSGTTAIACKETNRNYIGIEINEKWHKVAVDRLNNIDATGQIAFLPR
jgi:DNA modification methylase